MKAMTASLGSLLRALRSDLMLFFMLPVPLLCAVAFRVLAPMGEEWLAAYFHVPAVLSPYYLVFDLLTASMAPFILAYVSVMVVLEERDDGLARYLAVTPLGRTGYLVSRVGVPVLFGAVYTVPLLAFLSLSSPALWLTLLLALAGGLSGVIAALLVPALAENKVEGMAITKLSTLLMLGLFAPFFVSGPLRYLAAPLPSFWMAVVALTGQALYMLPLLGVSFLWLLVLYRRFSRKLL